MEPRPVFPGEVAPADVGMSADSLARLDALLDSALAAGAAPGAALAVGRHGHLVRLRGYGTLDREDTTRVTPASLFDVASMTKVVGTTTAVMLLVDRGRLSLDDRVVEHLPWWSGSDPRKAEVTVRQLLTHTAGLPAFRRWFLEMEGREAYRAAIAAEPLESAPGTRTVYSDIGVMTLALLIEETTGRPLDRFLEAEVFDALGMTDTGFNPDPSELDRIAPTEVDRLWRGGLHVRGIVHDENADAYGGRRRGGTLRSVSPRKRLPPRSRRAPAPPAGRDGGALHPAAVGGVHPRTGMGHARGPFVGRRLFHGGCIRAHRIHRHLHLDRSRAGSLRRPAHEPGESDSRELGACPSPPGRTRPGRPLHHRPSGTAAPGLPRRPGRAPMTGVRGPGPGPLAESGS
jgi:CubicO group peptidase (beta-lactamase class C family)